ncbi:MAG: serpin family protein, partial [candidate division KSB1 bacterium]|nr:serpin family protein [candidate division KSB1 bacterium]
DKNVFISPLSVAMALGMTYNGANGSTEAAMRATLEFGDLSSQEINASYKSLIELLSQIDPKVQFLLANSIWYRQEYTFEPEFINLNRTYFNAMVRGLNFNDPSAAKTINQWVEQNTKGKIKEIVDNPIDPATVMFLINAIYFKGIWTYQFDPQQTRDDWFTLLNGAQKSCKMMNLKADLKYFGNDRFQAVDLPYGDAGFSMMILLPGPQTNIDSLIAQFDQENWQRWMRSFSKQTVNLSLPKFTLEYDLTLNEVLKALGMGIAFSAQADFTRMRKIRDLFISKVKHKTFVEVNEEGTEAAAVTSVEMALTSTGGSREIWMRVERPFVFVIHENHSQTILFMGKIVEPVL